MPLEHLTEDLGCAIRLKRRERLTRITPQMQTCHRSLSLLFGEAFLPKLAAPMRALQCVMRGRGVDELRALGVLCEKAVDVQGDRSSASIIWLTAAAVELLTPTPLTRTIDEVLA